MRLLALAVVGIIALLFVSPGGHTVNSNAGPIHWQAAFSDLVPCTSDAYPGPNCPQPNGTKVITNATSVFTWQRELIPYTVPAGKELHITDIGFGSKHVSYSGNVRSSYLVVEGVTTVTEDGPRVSLSTPFIVPSGQTIRVTFMNNSPEPQWMNGYITGWLVDTPLSVGTPIVAAPTATAVVTPTVAVPTPTAVASTATRTATPTPIKTPTPTPWWCQFVQCA